MGVLVLCLIFEVLALTNGAAFLQAIEPEQNAPVSTFNTCTAPSIQTSYSSEANFNDQALEWHNYLRCVHGAPLMALDATLISGAQSWTTYMANNDDFDHDGNRGSCVGENIALAASSDNGAYRFVHGKYMGSDWGYQYTWYCGEYENYNFTSGTTKSLQLSIGHFTQIVWKDSTKLGCGVAQGTYTTEGGDVWPDTTYVTCRYSNAGNYPDQFTNNVDDYVTGYNYNTVCPTA